MSKPLVLYDGYCALCNRSVSFLQARQRPGALEYASLQSEHGQRLLSAAGLPTRNFDSIVVFDGGRIFLRCCATCAFPGRCWAGCAWRPLSCAIPFTISSLTIATA